MKNVFILLLCCALTSSTLFAQAVDGMAFHNGDWKTALETAAKENKLVFVDAYTTWCGPCKKMSKETFTQTAVGEFYNKHFVNVKMDMEKGEGIGLAQMYNVMVYPTLLFISPDGSVVHRSAGFHTTDQFLELGAIANDPSKRMSALDDRYQKGDRDPEFLLGYAMAKYDVMDGSHEKLGEEYLATQKDWSTPGNMKLIYNFASNSDSKMFDYMVANKKAFYDMFGEPQVTQSIQNMIFANIQDSKEKSSLEQVDEIYKKVYPEKAAKLSSAFRLTYYRQAGDRENYAKSAISYFKKFPSKDWDELNEAAWTFYRVVEDKKQLKTALKWAKKSTKLNDNFYNNDTKAALYFKLGKKKKAMKHANKAIDMAKTAGEDYSATQELLTEIQNMKK